MIPIHDINYRRRFPYVNYALIVLNVLIFLYEISLSDSGLNNLIARFAVTPADISSGHNLISLITSQFLHGGWLHIGSNMLWLWVFGDNIEDVFGHIPYLIFYLFCGIVAGLAQVGVDPGSTIPSLGASGAIAGVLGAYIIFFPRVQVTTVIFLGIFFFWTRLTALLVIGFFIVTQLFVGATQITHYSAQTSGDNVAYFAHIGGIATGLVIALVTRPMLRIPVMTGPPQNWQGRHGPWGGYGPRY